MKISTAFLICTLGTGAAGIKEAAEMDAARDMQDLCTAPTRDERATAHNWLLDHDRGGCEL